jgi:hypothetical protein
MVPDTDSWRRVNLVRVSIQCQFLELGSHVLLVIEASEGREDSFKVRILYFLDVSPQPTVVLCGRIGLLAFVEGNTIDFLHDHIGPSNASIECAPSNNTGNRDIDDSAKIIQGRHLASNDKVGGDPQSAVGCGQ